MRILFHADLRSSLALDFFRAVREESPTTEFVVVCSRTGQVVAANADIEPTGTARVSTTSWLIHNPKVLRTLGPTSLHVRALRSRSGSRQLTHEAEVFKPDIIHSLRLFNEALTTYYSNLDSPHVASVWGQEFVHYGRWSFFRWETRKLLRSLSGLTADCQRDIQLASRHDVDGPLSVLPTNLGVPDQFFSSEPNRDLLAEAAGRPIVLNPRGVRSYVQMDEYLDAIRLLVDQGVDAYFVLVDVSQSHWILDRVQKLNIAEHCSMTGKLDRHEMASALRAATIVVSPTTFDGTPNTLLESMAAEAFPVFSDLSSIREWITHGQNGLLFDPSTPQSIAAAVNEALTKVHGLQHARSLNSSIVRERASRAASVRRLREFYSEALSR